jgi:uncharacterized membrane protein YbhN (UPF0104 family)
VKDALRLALRLAIAAALLVLAFRLAIPADGRSIPEALSSAWVAPPPLAFAWFAAALLCFGLSFVAVARRFQVLLDAAGLETVFPTLLRAYVVANFLALVLPSALLSDVYRVVDARRDTGRSIEVIAVAAAERVLSLAALGIVVLVAAPFAPLPPDMHARLYVALAIAGGLVVTSLAFLLPASNMLLRRIARQLGRVSQSLAQSADSALDATAALSEKPGALLRAFGWSVAAQLLPVAAVICLSRPLDAHVADYWYAVIVPLVTLVTLIPVSIGGAGVREWLYVELFGSLGMRAEVALSLSLSVFAATLVWGFFGLALFAWGRRSQAGSAQ